MQQSNDLRIFTLVRDLKQDALTWAIFDALNCKIVALDDKSEHIAYADKNSNIMLNFKKIDSIDPSPDFTLFVLYHEIMHLYFSHFSLMRDDKMLDNVAKDYAINNYLFDLKGSFKKFKSMTKDIVNTKTLVSEMKVNENLLQALGDDSDSATIYDFLHKETEKNKGNKGKAPSNFCGTKTEELGHPSPISTKKLEEKIKASGAPQGELEKLERAERQVCGINNGEQGGEGIGKTEDGATGLARKILDSLYGKPSTEVLKILLRSVVANQKNRPTHKKSSRRGDDHAPGKVKLKQNKVCFIVDVSGSIGSDDLEVIYSMINNTTKNFSVVVRAVDDRLRNEVTLKKNDKLAEDFFPCGGGTDMNAGFLDTDSFLHYLIFTDGFIPPIESDKNRTLFLFTKHHAQVEGEKCFILKGDK